MKIQVVRYSVITAILLGASGCGQAFKTGGSTSTSSSTNAVETVDVSDSLAKAQQAADEAQKAMDEADVAIAQLMDSKGNIKLGALFANKDPVKTQGLLAPLINKLQPLFDSVFNKVNAVKVKMDGAKALLNAALAKLSAGDPQLKSITDQMTRILAMENTFQAAIHKLAGKLTMAITGIDRLVSMATSFIPIPGVGIVAGLFIDMFLVDDLKNMILDLQTKLFGL